MKQTLIKITDDHYVVVDNSEIKEGDWMIRDGEQPTLVTHDFWWDFGVPYKKITHSTQPIETFNWMGNSEKGYDTIKPLSLQEVKELIGEIDVSKKAAELAYSRRIRFRDDFNSAVCDGLEEGYELGYNQALEKNKDRKYTEEDLRNAYRHGTTVNHGTKEHFNSFIQSFQSKTEWEVTFDEQGKLRLV